MKTRYVGHDMFYVRDLEWSLMFYRDLLGFKEISRIFDGKAVALTSGHTHHELLLIEGGAGLSAPSGWRLGLYHIRIKIGDSLDELQAVKRELEEAGMSSIGMSNHIASQSLYLADPDGNEVELYVETDTTILENDPTAMMAPIKSLGLR